MKQTCLTPADHATYEELAAWWSELYLVGCFSGRPGTRIVIRPEPAPLPARLRLLCALADSISDGRPRHPPVQRVWQALRPTGARTCASSRRSACRSRWPRRWRSSSRTARRATRS
eukprot:1165013-Prymnesium_polylepis.1